MGKTLAWLLLKKPDIAYMNHKLLQSSASAYVGPHLVIPWTDQQIIVFGTSQVSVQNCLAESVILQCWGWNLQAKVEQILLMICYLLVYF